MARFADKHPRRSYEGKVYRAHSWFASKREAKELAGRLMGAGHLVRVVPFGKVWAVYVR